MIPWVYHRLTPRDQAGDLLRVVNFQREATGPNTIIQYRVPFEKMLLINSVNWFYSDAAGFVSQPWLFAITLDTTTVINMPMVRDATQGTLVPTTVSSVHRSGNPWMMVPPDHVINSIVTNGTAAGSHIFSFNGILIPHGTFSE